LEGETCTLYSGKEGKLAMINKKGHPWGKQKICTFWMENKMASVH
jgi:hypothetical protein